MFGLSEVAIILIVVILVLGANKLPELARSTGKSARILKAEARAMKKEKEQAEGVSAPEPQVVHGEVLRPHTAAAATPPAATPAPEPGRRPH
ncbi:twin-arginine translocase TatA/TatE family subunit [Streptomyces sp. NPDC054871]